MAPLTLEQTLRLAIQQHQAGQLPRAESLCDQILSCQPNHAEALHLLGVISAQTGRYPRAVEFIHRAVAINPEWAEAHYDLGNALVFTGELNSAIAAYQAAISLKPAWPQAYNNLGVVLKETGRLEEAAAAFQQGIALNPSDPNPHANLGNVFKDKRQYGKSIAAYRQAIALNPNLPEVHNNLGVVLKEIWQLDESATACRQAIALRPGFAEAHNNLGVVLEQQAKLDEAIIAYQRAITLKPEYAEAHYNVGNVLKATGRLDPSLAAYRQAMLLKPSLVEAHTNLVYAMHFHPAYDQQAIAKELARWNQQHAAPLPKFIQPHTNDLTPDRRLRIGYISPDFCEHPVGRFLLPLLARHDRTRFEIFAYSDLTAADSVTQQLRSNTDHWRDIFDLSDAQAADLIRQDRIDILIDLTMHMAHNRLLVFARKPAPVQVTWLAYCSSTGLETMDYRLSDPHLDPEVICDSFYTEKTFRLPETYWCYQPAVASKEVAPPPAINRGHITFGCLNNFCKVTEPTLAAWTRILQRVPDSQLLLHAPEGNHRRQLRSRLQQDGIEFDRIQFAGKVPLPDYFQLYNAIDIALDPFPYGGGTTTCDALWMGAAVISLLGKTAVGRGGASILSNVRLSELVARDEEEYVRLATKLATDLPRLTALRSTLRPHMEQSPLMDARRFARHMEATYRQMWQRCCASPEPVLQRTTDH